MFKRDITKLTVVTPMHPGDIQIEREIIEEREAFEESHKMDDDICSLITKNHPEESYFVTNSHGMLPYRFGSM